MSKSARLFLSLSEDELKKFEEGRNELGLNRSQYLRYLIAGQKEIRPPAIKDRAYISKLASIDRSIKAIAMREELSDTDRMLLYSKLDELKKMICLLAYSFAATVMMPGRSSRRRLLRCLQM